MTNQERWELYLRDIESPDVYIEWGFYHLIASALQRRVWMYSDPNTKLPGSHSLFANPYVVLVGPPATGKGRVITQESSIIKSPRLQKANAEGKLVPLIPFSPEKLTLEALIQHIASSVKSTSRKSPLDPTKMQQYAYSPCSFLIEELDVLFAQNTHDIVSVLTGLYDGHDLWYKTKHQGEDNIKNVCVSMISGTTPDSIRDLMANKVIKKGMASRSIMIYADKPRFYRQFPGIDPNQQKAYDDIITHVLGLTSLFGEVVMSSEAEAYHKRLYESGIIQNDRFNKDPRLDDYYGRKNIHWLKLMMILLYADQTDSNVITKEYVDRAWITLKRAELRMSDAFQTTGRNVLHESSIQMLRYLADKEKVSYRKLWWHFSPDLKKEEFDQCVGLLVETGQIRNNAGEFMLVRKADEQTTETTTITPPHPNGNTYTTHPSNSPTVAIVK